MSIFNEETKRNIANAMNADCYDTLLGVWAEEIQDLTNGAKSLTPLDRLKYRLYINNIKRKIKLIHFLTEEVNEILAKYGRHVRIADRITKVTYVKNEKS